MYLLNNGIIEQHPLYNFCFWWVLWSRCISILYFRLVEVMFQLNSKEQFAGISNSDTKVGKKGQVFLVDHARVGQVITKLFV